MGRILDLTGATTDWLDTREQGERPLEQATFLSRPSIPAAQETLRRCIAYEARMLSAVRGVECGTGS